MLNHITSLISKKNRSLIILGVFSCFFSSALNAKQLKCDIDAPCAILINAETGCILYEKNAHNPCYPASTTKIATALYALEAKGQELDREVIASHDAVATVGSAVRRNGQHPSYRLEYGGTHMGIKAGEVLPLRSLIYGLMVCSSNDAANVIAEHISGNVPKFVEEMNTFLQKIGCKETVFNNPHGLSHPEHKTSAYDLALMTSYALKHPFFREVVKTVRYKRPQTNKQPEALLLQSNALLRPGRYYYPHAIGVKTGYTAMAGQNIVAAAEKNGRKLIAVVLNSDERSKRYQSAITLFEKAFNEPKINRKLFAKEFDVLTKTLPGAKTALKASLKDDVFVQYYPSEEKEFSPVLHWDALQLPLARGSKVGEIQIKDAEGTVWVAAPLYAKEEVQPTTAYKVSRFTNSLILAVEHHKMIVGLIVGASILLLAFSFTGAARSTAKK